MLPGPEFELKKNSPPPRRPRPATRGETQWRCSLLPLPAPPPPEDSPGEAVRVQGRWWRGFFVPGGSPLGLQGWWRGAMRAGGTSRRCGAGRWCGGAAWAAGVRLGGGRRRGGTPDGLGGPDLGPLGLGWGARSSWTPGRRPRVGGVRRRRFLARAARLPTRRRPGWRPRAGGGATRSPPVPPHGDELASPLSKAVSSYDSNFPSINKVRLSPSSPPCCFFYISVLFMLSLKV